MWDVFKRVYWGNSVETYALVTLITITVLSVSKILDKKVLNKVNEKIQLNAASRFIATIVSAEGLRLLRALVIYQAIRFIHISSKAEKLIHAAFLLVILFFTIQLLSKLIRFFVEVNSQPSENSSKEFPEPKGIMLIVNIILWSLSVVFFINNQGYNVSAILTGLGIGGIAIALAAQNILVDIFNYFVIFFDRPFAVGDFIITGDLKGTVEYIGLKTTRVRSLEGEQLIVSNSDLTKSRIHNYKRMDKRRVAFTLKVARETSIIALRSIPSIIKEIIKKQDKAFFDHATMMTLGDYSFDFEIVYILEDPDYNFFADIQQSVNFEIIETLRQNKIALAVPTQVVISNIFTGNNEASGTEPESMQVHLQK